MGPRRFDLPHLLAHAEGDAPLAQGRGEVAGEEPGIAALVARRVEGTGEPVADGLVDRVESRRLVRRDGADLDPLVAQDLRVVGPAAHAFRVAVEVEGAAAPAAILDPGLLDHLMQPTLAVEAQGHLAAGVVGRLLARALEGEAERPEPETRVLLHPEAQGQVVATECAQEGPQGLGRRPGIGVARCHHPGIAVGGLAGGLLTAVDDRHLVPVAQELVGGGDADDAGPDHGDAHQASPAARLALTNEATASTTVSGASRCGAWPTPGRRSVRCGPASPRAIASTWRGVP